MKLLRIFNRPFSTPRKKKKIALRPVGRVYNLKEIYHQINQEYFQDRLSLYITWYGRGTTVPKSKMTFGSYSFHNQLIRVNRLLDDENVPFHFVRYIVYHEMLHHVYPPKRRRRGVHHIHHVEFKEAESRFKEYEEAKSFVKKFRAMHFENR